MKKVLFALVFALEVMQFGIGLGNENKGEMAYEGHRPFSWYYPYSYQYYYPRPRYDASHYEGGCYWIYIDGNYYYYCPQQ